MIRVLVVDDSALVRRVLTEELSRFPDIEVVGTASDPFVARDRIAELRPDVLTLDLEMPRMDGLTFLEKLMTHFPLPVVVVSSVAPKNSAAALRALELGAVEVVPKPGSSFSVPDVSRLLVHAVRAAGMARVQRHGARPSAPDPAHTHAHTHAHASNPAQAPNPAPRLASVPGGAASQAVLAMGASTGGTRALEAVLTRLPLGLPGIVIVQHMPPGFTRAFAERMDRLSALSIREAAEGDAVEPGTALVAPGDHHMTVVGSPGRFHVRLDQGPPLHHQRPAVDRLFESVADRAGAGAVGVILTGMGADGAVGCVAMREAGAHVLAQDEATCVVFGMPREAIRRGGADQVLPLGEIPGAMVRAAGRVMGGVSPSSSPRSRRLAAHPAPAEPPARVRAR